MFAESERILSEKRKLYSEFLNTLPPLNDTYLFETDEEFLQAMRPAIEKLPGFLFYADKSVTLAWSALLEKYQQAHERLDRQSPALAPEYLELAKAQNDLILEMRRDAFRWSFFNYSGKSRVPQNSTYTPLEKS
jgi:hypothetical protein